MRTLSYLPLVFITFSLFISCSRKCLSIKEYDNSVLCSCKKVKGNDSIAKQIENYRYSVTNQMAYYSYCPLLMSKKNKVGIYQYWTGGVHTHRNNFFIYDSEKIIYIKSDNFDTMKSFLKEKNFNDKQIEKVILKIRKCNDANKNVGDKF